MFDLPAIVPISKDHRNSFLFSSFSLILIVSFKMSVSNELIQFRSYVCTYVQCGRLTRNVSCLQRNYKG